MTGRMLRIMAPACSITPSASLPNDTIGMAAAAHSGVISDEALAAEFVEAMVHEGHAFFAPGVDSVFELVELVFANEIADRAVCDDEFVGENAPSAIGGREKVLRDDALQSIGELENDLALSAAFE